MAKRDVMRAVRAKCLDCCCGSPYEVNKCTVVDCALYQFRFGKDPTASKKNTDSSGLRSSSWVEFKSAMDSMKNTESNEEI